jgi:hypothetical protein
MLRVHNIRVDKYKLRCVSNIDGTFSQAVQAKKLILLNTSLTLDASAWEQLTCTALIEEYIHLEWNVRDYSREFQDVTTNMIYEMMAHWRASTNPSMLHQIETALKVEIVPF